MWSAVSHAWQSWKHSKAVAALAIAALAVGIGSATAIYTVVNTVMLRPLPYPDGERFVALYGASLRSPEGRSSHTYPTLLQLSAANAELRCLRMVQARGFQPDGSRSAAACRRRGGDAFAGASPWR